VYHFLQEAAKPDRDFLAWYSPSFDPEGLAPDLILFGNCLGVLVLGVRDWALSLLWARPLD
jgi:hypothetical protein